MKEKVIFFFHLVHYVTIQFFLFNTEFTFSYLSI